MKDFDKVKPFLPFEGKGLMILAYRGSLAHGTFIPQHIDDRDYLGIVIPPIEYLYGLKNYEQTEKMEGETDLVLYSFKKAVNLLSSCNPNVISILWNKDDKYLYKSPLGQKLIDNRELFLSKKIYYTFCGYAESQIRKMQQFKFEGYMGEKRKKLVDTFGYDCKNAQHSIRILQMGLEALVEGKVNVWREDSQKYISIKQGEWTLDQVKEEAKRLRNLVDQAYINTKLPDNPDYDKIEKLMIEIQKEFYAHS